MPLLQPCDIQGLPLFRQERAADPDVHMIISLPGTKRDWYITEGHRQKDDYYLFGLVVSFESDWGELPLSDLERMVSAGGNKPTAIILRPPQPLSVVRGYRAIPTEIPS